MPPIPELHTVDRLSGLISRFELRAQVFYAGETGAAAWPAQAYGRRASHLHLVRSAPVWLRYDAAAAQPITEPCAVFLPRPPQYALDATGAAQAGVVSAAIEFGGADENPILRGLPALLTVPLARVPSLDALLQLLFEEATARRCGHTAVVSRLIEILMVELLRYAMRNQLVDSGSLAGLSDPRLAKALIAMHADPTRAWTLERLAEAAGMSRSRFAAHFGAVVGLPPGEYLMRWRIGLAKALLRRGRPLKQVAAEVGYGSASALARAFANGVGMSTTNWLAAQGDRVESLDPGG